MEPVAGVVAPATPWAEVRKKPRPMPSAGSLLPSAGVMRKSKLS